MVMRPAGVPFPNCQSCLLAAHFCLPARIVHPPTALTSPFLDIGQIFPHSVGQLGRWPPLLSWEGQNSCSPALSPVVLVLTLVMHQEYSLVHVPHIQKAKLVLLTISSLQ